jgi:hypothetical protein
MAITVQLAAMEKRRQRSGEEGGCPIGDVEIGEVFCTR